LRYAGDKFNDAIVQYMRKTYSLLIGEQTAEELKINIGCALIDYDEDNREIIEYMDARGRDLVTGLPKTVRVTNKDMFYALEESVQIVVEGIKSTFERTAPEIAADIVENGIVLSGGGGLLKNLDKIITEKTGMNVVIAENAFEAVALGTGKSLLDIEKLKKYAATKESIKYR
ncbi:MAG: rod shape-determining protein, partial [Firmicutes bacterium]|nr:rod shape-determining protein [Bacillota bacterium]